MQSNVASQPNLSKPRKFDAMFASMIAEAEDKHDAAEFLTRITRDVKQVKPPEARKKRTENPTCFEFCCSRDSTLGSVNEKRGINHFRLSADICNMFPNSTLSSGSWNNFQAQTFLDQSLVVRGQFGNVSTESSTVQSLSRS